MCGHEYTEKQKEFRHIISKIKVINSLINRFFWLKVFDVSVKLNLICYISLEYFISLKMVTRFTGNW